MATLGTEYRPLPPSQESLTKPPSPRLTPPSQPRVPGGCCLGSAGQGRCSHQRGPHTGPSEPAPAAPAHPGTGLRSSSQTCRGKGGWRKPFLSPQSTWPYLQEFPKKDSFLWGSQTGDSRSNKWPPRGQVGVCPDPTALSDIGYIQKPPGEEEGPKGRQRAVCSTTSSPQPPNCQGRPESGTGKIKG